MAGAGGLALSSAGDSPPANDLSLLVSPRRGHGRAPIPRARRAPRFRRRYRHAGSLPAGVGPTPTSEVRRTSEVGRKEPLGDMGYDTRNRRPRRPAPSTAQASR